MECLGGLKIALLLSLPSWPGLGPDHAAEHQCAADEGLGGEDFAQQHPACHGGKDRLKAQDDGRRGRAGVALGHDLQGVGHADAHESAIEDGDDAGPETGQGDFFKDRGSGQADQAAEGELDGGQFDATPSLA